MSEEVRKEVEPQEEEFEEEELDEEESVEEPEEEEEAQESEEEEEKPAPRKRKSRAEKRIRRLIREKKELLRRLRELEQGRWDDNSPAYEELDEDELVRPNKVYRNNSVSGLTDEERAMLVDELDIKFDDARDRYKDFDVLIRDPDLPVTDDVLVALNELDNPGEVIYYLAKHPDKAERIANMKPHRIAVELGKIDAFVLKSKEELKQKRKKKDIKIPERTKTTANPLENDYFKKLEQEKNPFWDD